MAKTPSVSASSCSLSCKQETFTVWMRSLILNGKGCTVFDSSGEVVYRVDNYSSKSTAEVYLMDTKGTVLFTLLKKKSKLFRLWEGYRFAGKEMNEKKLAFQVRKLFKISKGNSPCNVDLWLEEDKPCMLYKIETCRSSTKTICRILDQFGGLVAEMTRKHSNSGVILGDDVLTMVVEPNTDHALIMGLLVVYGTINHKM